MAKEREKELRTQAKAEEEKRRKEEALLTKPVQIQKVPFGVDPKTLLCAFYKAGHCDKGTKCKFSHDKDIERKVEKKNLYADSREEKMAGEFFDLQYWFSEGKADGIGGAHRYDGHVGRGKATAGCALQTWKPENNNRCMSLSSGLPSIFFLIFGLHL